MHCPHKRCKGQTGFATEHLTRDARKGRRMHFCRCGEQYMPSLRANVSKHGSGMVLSPVPSRSFRSNLMRDENTAKQKEEKTGTNRRDSGTRFSLNASEPAPSGSLGKQRTPRNTRRGERSTHEMEHPFVMDEEEERYPQEDTREEGWFMLEDMSPPSRKRKEVPEEEEQLRSELVSIFQDPSPDLESPRQHYILRRDSEDFLDLNSPPPRASNPITQNQSFGRGVGEALLREAFERHGQPREDRQGDDDDQEEDHGCSSFYFRGRSDGLLRSCSAPAISL